MEVNELKDKIKEMADEVLKELGPYYKESVYEEAFIHELRLNGIPYERQRNIEIIYKGYSIGMRRPDCILYPKWSGSDEEFLVEMKSVKNVSKSHINQGKVYLFSLNIPKGVILNFNTSKKEAEVIEIFKEGERKIEKEVVKPQKIEGNLRDILLRSAKNVMEYLGTEFFYYEKKKDLYIEAIGVELRLNGLEFWSKKMDVLYKSHKVTGYEYEYVFPPDGETVKVATYSKEDDIEKSYEEMKFYNKLFNIKKGYVLALPEKESKEVILREIEC